jgi:hypothetical protein
MAELLVTNQGSSLTWQMGGTTLSLYCWHNTIDYGVWQGTTHFEVIIDDTHYCVIGGNSDHRSLRLQLNIDYSFVER